MHTVLIVLYATYALVSITVLPGLKYHREWLGKLNEKIISNKQSDQFTNSRDKKILVIECLI